jgi:hypothetical protein
MCLPGGEILSKSRGNIKALLQFRLVMVQPFYFGKINGEELCLPRNSLSFFSFARKPNASFLEITSAEHFARNFNLSLSIQEHQQFSDIQNIMDNLQVVDGSDLWLYTWGSALFSTSKTYKSLIGHKDIHPIYKWLWKSKCLMKHKVLFWLLLKYRISTKDLIRRKDMELDSYTCEMCIIQNLETSAHLILRCDCAKACWLSIGASVPTTRDIPHIFNSIRRKIGVSFSRRS